MTIGLTREGADQRVEVFSDGDVYRKVVFEGDRLVGAILMGDVEHAGVLTSLIRSQGDVSSFERHIVSGDLLGLSAFRKAASTTYSPRWVERNR